MNRWLRRWMSTNTSLSPDLTVQQHALTERNEANMRVVAAVWLAVEAWRVAVLACRQADEARALMRAMVEPGEVDRCQKVRLRSKEEAEAFAARVFEGTGERCVPRKCRYCPLQPVSLEKFWHITSADPERRGKRGQPYRHPARLLRHVSPEQADALRARVRGDGS